MNNTQIIFDADGVLLDSRAHAWEVGSRILSVLGRSIRFSTPAEYRQHFGRTAIDALVGSEHAAVLRAMHRIAMCHRGPDIAPFASVLSVVGRITIPAAVVTAALAEGVRLALKEHASLFTAILGHEQGRKADLLSRLLLKGSSIYVTDTVRDISICRSLALPVVAVSWGYDSPEMLAAALPDHLVRQPAELADLFDRMGLLTPRKEQGP